VHGIVSRARLLLKIILLLFIVKPRR
jgi:hypothetical protein